jgi:hypothetical protein
MADYRVERCKTAEDCESFARNVEKTHPELARDARRRAVILRAEAEGASTEAEHDALRAVNAFEEVRSQEAGKRVRSSRTRQSFQRNGILTTVENVVSRNKPTEGYTALVAAGMEDFTFEAVVLRHPENFTPLAIENATRRIAEREA